MLILLILYKHAQIFIHEGDMLCIVFQRFANNLFSKNRIVDFLIYLHIIHLKNDLKIGV